MEKFKSFTSKIKIDSIKSKPNPDKDPENVSSEWRDIVIESPPMNSSDEVKSEMMTIKRETESRTTTDDFSILSHDMVATQAIRDYMDKNKLSWDVNVVNELTDISGQISRHFKNIFLRARPYQLEEPLGIKIKQSMDRDTDKAEADHRDRMQDESLREFKRLVLGGPKRNKGWTSSWD